MCERPAIASLGCLVPIGELDEKVQPVRYAMERMTLEKLEEQFKSLRESNAQKGALLALRMMK